MEKKDSSDWEEEMSQNLDSVAMTITQQDSGFRSDQVASPLPKVTDKTQVSQETIRFEGGEDDEEEWMQTQENKAPFCPFIASTPKKESINVQGGTDHEVRLEDKEPQFSPIDEMKAQSLTSENEESKYLTPIANETHINDLLLTKPKQELLNEMPDREKFLKEEYGISYKEGQTFLEMLEEHNKLDTVKRNLFDTIPVSPKLKNRVRQRLYTLVNSIENNEDEHTQMHTSPSMKFRKTFSINNLENVESTENNSSTFSTKPRRHSIDVAYSRERSHRLRELVQSYGYSPRSDLPSQLNSLQRKDQDEEGGVSVGGKKEDEESDARLALYLAKIKLMTQMVEELEARILSQQTQAKEQQHLHQRRMEERESIHQKEMALLRAECQNKIDKAEAEMRSAKVNANKTCESKILKLVSRTQVKSTALENKHQTQITDLKKIIDQLKAKNKDLDTSLLISEADRMKLTSDATLNKDEREAWEEELEKRVKRTALRLELQIEGWKKKAEELRDIIFEADITHGRSIEALKARHKNELEMMEVQNASVIEELKTTIENLNENWLQVGKENKLLHKRLSKDKEVEQCLIRERCSKESEIHNLTEQLRLAQLHLRQEKENISTQLEKCQYHQKNIIDQYEHDREKETAEAVRAALTHYQENTRKTLTDLRTCYETHIQRIHTYSTEQIKEYKKAVRSLKANK